MTYVCVHCICMYVCSYALKIYTHSSLLHTDLAVQSSCMHGHSRTVTRLVRILPKAPLPCLFPWCINLCAYSTWHATPYLFPTYGMFCWRIISEIKRQTFVQSLHVFSMVANLQMQLHCTYCGTNLHIIIHVGCLVSLGPNDADLSLHGFFFMLPWVKK